MKIVKTFLLFPFVIISLCSCKKKSDEFVCPTSTALFISGPLSVTQGWDIYLSIAYANPIFKYVASGPNGWSMVITGRQAIRTNIQMQDAGIYFIRAYNDKNCPVEEGSLSVAVTVVEDAPCQGILANNSSTTDFPGLSSINYSSVTFTPDIANNLSIVRGNTTAPIPANTYLALTFKGTTNPKPGKYRTLFAYNAAGISDEVAVHFSDGTTNQLNLSQVGQYIYVTMVNGRTQICFCNLAVSYTISGMLKYISGKITIN